MICNITCKQVVEKRRKKKEKKAGVVSFSLSHQPQETLCKRMGPPFLPSIVRIHFSLYIQNKTTNLASAGTREA